MEEIDQPTNLECNVSTQNSHVSKKRKMGERVVVSMKIEESNKKQKRSEGPPEDCWSWRKYGQKPIKGSPYPRGYYRCSTSKGCLAKKQVEICKTDSTMLIITYTSSHNHPGPNSDSDSSPSRPEENVTGPGSVSCLDENSLGDNKLENSVEITDDQPTTSTEQDEKLEQTQSEIPVNEGTEEQFHYSQSPFNSSQDHIMVNQESNNPFGDQTHVLFFNESILQQPFSEDSLNLSSIMFKSEENDFYDELEELPSSSFLTSFMKGSLCNERVLVNP